MTGIHETECLYNLHYSNTSYSVKMVRYLIHAVLNIVRSPITQDTLFLNFHKVNRVCM